MKRISASRYIIKNLRHTLLYLPSLTHVRHFRGHGVHSPFVYGLIRDVLMKRNLACNGQLYDVLRSRQVPKRCAVQLQHLYNRYNYAAFHLVEAEGQLPIDNHSLYIVLPHVASNLLFPLAQQLKGNASALCILSPRSNHQRLHGCETLIRQHGSTSLDNRRFQILFYDEHLPKQHFKL